MSAIIVIDDERTFKTEPGVNVIYYRTAWDFIECLTLATADYYWAPEGAEIEGDFDVDEVWWDHDLGEDGGDVMDCIKVLQMFEDFGVTGWSEIPMFVHSQNPVGAQNIVDRLSLFVERVERVPLPELEDAVPEEV